ncbi:MAG: glycosyltransferase [Bacteroidales bacterium]|nr:glycosyltransferase [Bacteroidales bacterium]
MFFIFLLLLLYTYIFFPIFLIVLNKIIEKKNRINENIHESVSIIIPAYNEEKVIEKKLLSIIESNYPLEKIEILVGSDSSTDKTNEILKNFEKKYKNIKPYFFKERQGKVKILNHLVKEAAHNILIITDANVIFDKNTIFELVKNFKDKSIGLVDSRIIHYNVENKGISAQEHAYISLEFLIKKAEGDLFGATMGTFGGCYAIRKELFTIIPDNFLVDDFFISMNVLLKGYKTITEENAIVYEDVSSDIFLEYRRKKRIATGCFQNLFYFKKLLLDPFSKISFIFISHKVIRWKTPFLLFSLVLISFILFNYSFFYKLFFLAFILTITLFFLDILFYKNNINLKYLRFLTHFVFTNIAILNGLLNFILGVKSSIWNPTPRLQHNE